MSSCCGTIALGQVMTRMRLDWSAKSTGDRPDARGLSPFKIMVILTLVYYLLYMLVSTVTQPYTTTLSEDGTPPVVPGWVALLVGIRSVFGFSVFLYALVASIRTRAYIRNKYAIPEQYCSGCDDFCLSLCCSCCTSAQMLRHTADYGARHSADCCSETGLSQQFSYPV
jgi:Cys-rich protein (TIGR01571 family)